MDGSGDEHIHLQGVPDYSFTDADGGDAGVDAGMDPGEAAQQDSIVEEDGVDGEGEAGEEGGEQAVGLPICVALFRRFHGQNRL